MYVLIRSLHSQNKCLPKNISISIIFIKNDKAPKTGFPPFNMTLFMYYHLSHAVHFSKDNNSNVFIRLYASKINRHVQQPKTHVRFFVTHKRQVGYEGYSF